MKYVSLHPTVLKISTLVSTKMPDDTFALPTVHGSLEGGFKTIPP